MASNKTYNLTESDVALRDIDKHGQAKSWDSEEPEYVNTVLTQTEPKTVEQMDHDYEILKRVSPTTKQKKSIKLTNNYAIMSVVGVQFFALIGIAVTFGVMLENGKAVKGSWSDWESWGQCSASCGFGITRRNRKCTNPHQTGDEHYCTGDTNEYSLCINDPCGVTVTNGGWGAWSTWGQCSATCYTGIQTKQRTCTNPRPSNGGDHCFGDSSKYQLCNTVPCPVTVIHGGWSAWPVWGLCSATCNTGIQIRQRTCTNPRPINGGDHCFGDSSEYQLCNRVACQVTKGGWASWTSWSPCSRTCMKTRTRNCTNPAPSETGIACVGNSEEKENCDLTPCALSRFQVRLADGSSASNGRLEVSLNGSVWGTVCDDDFDSNDARVACRMLGFTGSGVLTGSSVKDGNGSIFLDDLACSGYESNLIYCKHGGWGNHNCGHGEDVGLSC